MTAMTHWKDSVRTVGSTPALGDHIVAELRRLIVAGQLQAGARLVESDLSETFQVSRGPVRDALRHLETEGLVESRRGGTYVVGLSLGDIEELYVLRELLESAAIRISIAAGTTDYPAARQALDAMRQAAAEGDVDAFAVADLDFHSSFYVTAGNRRLRATWLQYRPTFANMLRITNAEDRDLSPTLRDHEQFLHLIEQQDTTGALALLEEHIQGSRRRMLDAYRHLSTTTR